MRRAPAALADCLGVAAVAATGILPLGAAAEYEAALAWSRHETAWVAAAFFLAAPLTLLVGRYWSALRGRPARAGAIIALLASAAGVAYAHDPSVAALLRAVAGLSGGVVAGASAGSPPSRASGRLPAASVLGLAIGLASGLAVGPLVVDVGGWRAPAVMSAVVTALALLSLVVSVPTERSLVRARFGWGDASIVALAAAAVGALISVATVVFAVIELSDEAHRIRLAALVPGSLAILAGAILAAAGQQRVPRHAVRIGGAWLLFVAAVLFHLRGADWEPAGLGLIFLVAGTGLGFSLAADGRELCGSFAGAAAIQLGAGLAIVGTTEFLVHRAGARSPLDPIFGGHHVAASDAALVAAGAALLAFVVALFAPIHAPKPGPEAQPDDELGFAWQEAT